MEPLRGEAGLLPYSYHALMGFQVDFANAKKLAYVYRFGNFPPFLGDYN
jgi:hypothetical protein